MAKRKKTGQVSLCAPGKQVHKESSQENRAKISEECWGPIYGGTLSLWFHLLVWVFYCPPKQRNRVIRYVDSSREGYKQESETGREKPEKTNKNNFVKNTWISEKLLESFWTLPCTLNLVTLLLSLTTHRSLSISSHINILKLKSFSPELYF